MRYILVFITTIAIALCCSCGGGSSAATTTHQELTTAPSITITPLSATVGPGGVQQFVAAVLGLANTAVSWSIQEGAAGGAIDASGKYTAPMTAGTYHVVAVSQANPSLTATATIMVTVTVTAGEAQGVYVGTYPSLNFQQLYAIVLPDDMYYEISGYTNADGSMVQPWTMRTGQGKSDHGSYTAAVTQFFDGSLFAMTLAADYVPAISLNGYVQFTSTGSVLHFNAKTLDRSALNFDVPADLSQITGTWEAWNLFELAGDPTYRSTLNIASSGELAVGDYWNCAYATITPDTSKNFFTVNIPAACFPENTPGSGVAVEMLLPNGTTRQLLIAAVVGNRPVVFVAQR